MEILYFLIWIALSSFVGNYGSKREIGYNWSFFFSFFFSPVIGWAIASGIPKIKGEIVTEPPTFLNKMFAVVFFIIGIFLFGEAIYTLISNKHANSLFKNEYLNVIYGRIALGIGFIGSAMYVSRIKRFRYSNIPKIIDENSNQKDAMGVNKNSETPITMTKARNYDFHNIIYWVMAIFLIILLIIAIAKR